MNRNWTSAVSLKKFSLKFKKKSTTGTKSPTHTSEGDENRIEEEHGVVDNDQKVEKSKGGLRNHHPRPVAEGGVAKSPEKKKKGKPKTTSKAGNGPTDHEHIKGVHASPKKKVKKKKEDGESKEGAISEKVTGAGTKKKKKKNLKKASANGTKKKEEEGHDGSHENESADMTDKGMGIGDGNGDGNGEGRKSSQKRPENDDAVDAKDRLIEKLMKQLQEKDTIIEELQGKVKTMEVKSMTTNEEKSPSQSSLSKSTSDDLGGKTTDAAVREDAEEIYQELNSIIKETEEEQLEDEMEPEAVQALKVASLQVCNRKKFYDVLKDEFILFPSVARTIVDYSLIEEAAKHYYEGSEEFPEIYVVCLRAVADIRLADDELDYDYMETLAVDVEISTMPRTNHTHETKDGSDEKAENQRSNQASKPTETSDEDNPNKGSLELTTGINKAATIEDLGISDMLAIGLDAMEAEEGLEAEDYESHAATKTKETEEEKRAAEMANALDWLQSSDAADAAEEIEDDLSLGLGSLGSFKPMDSKSDSSNSEDDEPKFNKAVATEFKDIAKNAENKFSSDALAKELDTLEAAEIAAVSSDGIDSESNDSEDDELKQAESVHAESKVTGNSNNPASLDMPANKLKGMEVEQEQVPPEDEDEGNSSDDSKSNDSEDDALKLTELVHAESNKRDNADNLGMSDLPKELDTMEAQEGLVAEVENKDESHFSESNDSDDDELKLAELVHAESKERGPAKDNLVSSDMLAKQLDTLEAEEEVLTAEKEKESHSTDGVEIESNDSSVDELKLAESVHAESKERGPAKDNLASSDMLAKELDTLEAEEEALAAEKEDTSHSSDGVEIESNDSDDDELQLQLAESVHAESNETDNADNLGSSNLLAKELDTLEAEEEESSDEDGSHSSDGVEIESNDSEDDELKLAESVHAQSKETGNADNLESSDLLAKALDTLEAEEEESSDEDESHCSDGIEIESNDSDDD